MEVSTGSLWRNKSYIQLLVLVFFMHLATYLVIPVFPVLMQKVRMLSLSQVGLVLGAGSIASLAGSLLGGPLSDRFGRRLIIVWGAILQGVAMTGYHFSDSFLLFLLASSLNGLGAGLLAPTLKALIADRVTSAQRTAAFSWRGIAAHAAIIVAGLTITWLTSMNRQPFLISALVFGILAVFTLLRLPADRLLARPNERRRPLSEYRRIVSHRSYLFFSGIMLLVWALYGQFALVLPLRGEHVLHTATMIGLIWTINSSSVVLFQGLISRFVLQRINPYLSLTIGILFIGSGLTVLGWADHFFTLSGAGLLFILGEMLMMPVQDTLVVHFSRTELLGAYFGFSNFVAGIGTALGTSIGGTMVEKLGGVGSKGPWITYGLATLFLVAVLGLFALYAMPRHGKGTPVPDKPPTRLGNRAGAR
ncbi:MFS transporter [Brevibacillus sp. TJ4]|uniref:MFS transporter n=1 Tax=Brevibacillus sp. TJ4 TaxID=3234853 RepID=UPI003BA10437